MNGLNNESNNMNSNISTVLSAQEKAIADGKKVGEGRIDRTQPGIFSADETVDVGIDLATPVVERIGAEAKSKFNGRIPKLVVEVK
jgi:hypothetical protein